MDERRSLTVIGPVRLLVKVLALEVVFVAYFGPDVVMPLGSALAAGIGVILVFWQRGVRLVRGGLERLSGTRPHSTKSEQGNASCDH